MTNKIAQAFYQAYNGHRHMMTPEVFRYDESEKYYIELSYGNPFLGNYPFGVTVLQKGSLAQRTDLSKAFFHKDRAQGLQEAEAYIRKLKKNNKEKEK